MFRSFRFGNFLSFCQPQQFDFNPPGKGAVSLVYGANASGKTNLFKALSFFKDAIEDDNPIMRRRQRRTFLLDTVSLRRPSHFEIVIDIRPKVECRYGFQIKPGGIIASEWLYEKSLRKQKVAERRVFYRDRDQFRFGDDPNHRSLQKYSKNIPPHTLALLRFARENHFESYQLINMIASRLSLIGGSQDIIYSSRFGTDAMEGYSNNPDLLEKANEIVNECDLAINSFSVDVKKIIDPSDSPFPRRFHRLGDLDHETSPRLRSLNDGYKIVRASTRHNVYDHKGEVDSHRSFSLSSESLGTRKLISLLFPILLNVKQGGLLVIDEFAGSWHPHIAIALLRALNGANSQVSIYSNNP